MASVNQTRLHCVNQMGKTHSKPLAARHGRGKAWARHSMCESAFRGRRTGLRVDSYLLLFAAIVLAQVSVDPVQREFLMNFAGFSTEENKIDTKDLEDR